MIVLRLAGQLILSPDRVFIFQDFTVISLKPIHSSPQTPDFINVYVTVVVSLCNGRRSIQYYDFFTDHDKNLDFVIFVWRKLAPLLNVYPFVHASSDGCSRQFKRLVFCS
jgi:hypothetical protein